MFLVLLIFPDDYKFERDDLIQYWIEEGLIEWLDSRQAELDKGNVILDELIHSSLLEKNNKFYKSVKMHDMVRDMAHIIVKVESQLQDAFESVQVLFYNTMLESFSNSAPDCSKLKTLILEQNDIKEFSDCFFHNMQVLNVLHAELIPDSITNLGNLRVLIIKDCLNMKCIPSLAGLGNLRHLIISRNDRLKEIPKGIGGLIKLGVLELSRNDSLYQSFPTGVVEKLSCLQTLNLRGSRFEVEAEALITLKKLETLHVHFYNLQNLNCYLNSRHWQRLLNYHIHYGEQLAEHGTWSKTMSFKAIRDAEQWNEGFGVFIPNDIQYLKIQFWESHMFYFLKNPNFGNLQYLRIGMHRTWCLLDVEFCQNLLHNIQHLVIHDCEELEEIITGKTGWVDLNNNTNYPTMLLPKLKRLELGRLGNLRTIYKGKMVCPSLEFIQIYKCNNLERLPFCMEEHGNTQSPTIKLEGTISSRWWDSLDWDDPNAKSLYLLPTLSSGEDDAAACEDFIIDES